MMKMIDMKRIYRFFGALTWMAALVSLAACSDFWEPETEDEFNGDQGFTANTEMYTGFLGIMTKVPGGFITLGLMMILVNAFKVILQKRRAGKEAAA